LQLLLPLAREVQFAIWRLLGLLDERMQNNDAPLDMKQ
jgi:hypothetical protein